MTQSGECATSLLDLVPHFFFFVHANFSDPGFVRHMIGRAPFVFFIYSGSWKAWMTVTSSLFSGLPESVHCS